MFVRTQQTLCLLILVAGCTETAPERTPPSPATVGQSLKPIPPLLPITISDVLQLPDIAIDEADGIGPGRRYWHLITGRGFPYVYAEAHDEPFLTKLEVAVYTSEPGTIGDHLKIIHDTFCRLRPDDPWIKATWPDSGASGFSLPASVDHDGMTLAISREEKSTKLTVTATEQGQENLK